MDNFYLHRKADSEGNLAGVEIVGDAPKTGRMSQNLVLKGMGEGWITAEGHEVVTRPAGRPDAPWQPTPTAPTPHVFHHYEFLTICGIRYQVTHNPDKYAAEGGDKKKVTDEMYAAGETRVDWFYDLKQVGNG